MAHFTSTTRQQSRNLLHTTRNQQILNATDVEQMEISRVSIAISNLVYAHGLKALLEKVGYIAEVIVPDRLREKNFVASNSNQTLFVCPEGIDVMTSARRLPKKQIQEQLSRTILVVDRSHESELERFPASLTRIVTNESDFATFEAALKAVATGCSFIDPIFDVSAEVTRLTPRQLEVLQLTSDGMTSAAIGKALKLSPRTVETHRANIKARLNISSTVAVILHCKEKNWIR